MRRVSLLACVAGVAGVVLSPSASALAAQRAAPHDSTPALRALFDSIPSFSRVTVSSIDRMRVLLPDTSRYHMPTVRPDTSLFHMPIVGPRPRR